MRRASCSPSRPGGCHPNRHPSWPTRCRPAWLASQYFDTRPAETSPTVLSVFRADVVQCEPSDEARTTAAAAGARFLPVLHDGPDLDRQLAAVDPRSAGPAAILEAAGKGGRGVRPNWERAAELAREFPLVLAGGLAPGNVADAIASVRPFGVDVSSGVEEARGRKDPVRIAAFVEAARSAAAQRVGDRKEQH